MTDVPPQAAPWYGWAISLDVAADRGRDGRLVIDLGRAMARELHLPPPGRDRVFVLDALATFVRAWSRHEAPDKAHDLIEVAEAIELERDLAIATMPRSDA